MTVTRKKRRGTRGMKAPSSAAPGAERAAFDSFALSNMRGTTTGIEGVVIWVSAGEFGGAEPPHGPRLKVVLGDDISTERLQDAVSVLLTTPPRVLGELPRRTARQLVRFVNENRDILLRHWKGELDTREMFRLLVRA